MRRALSTLTLLGTLAAAPLLAQQRLYTVHGVVRDTALAPVAGVEVLVLSPRRSTLTDAAGRFTLDSVPEGLRHLLIRRIGYLPVRPSVRLPEAAGDTVRAVLLPAAQNLAPLIVVSERPGIRGVVGDTSYRALPGTLVELLGAQRVDTTDERGRFGFEALKQGQYVLRVSRVGYVARLITVNLLGGGREYSVFLEQHRPGVFDWANTMEAAHALPDLATRLATEPRRTRLTRDELERYGTMALCDIPRLRFRNGEPAILLRGTSWLKNTSLCAWSADELDLVEWNDDPCKEAAKTIAGVLGIYCSPKRAVSMVGAATSPDARPPWVAIWPRS